MRPELLIKRAQIVGVASLIVAVAALFMLLIPNMSARSTANQRLDAARADLAAAEEKLAQFSAAGLTAEEFAVRVAEVDAAVPYSEADGIDPAVTVRYALAESAARAGVDIGSSPAAALDVGSRDDVQSLRGFEVTVQTPATPEMVAALVDDLTASGFLVTVDRFKVMSEGPNIPVGVSQAASMDVTLTFWFSDTAPLSR